MDYLARGIGLGFETVFPRRCAGCGRRGTWVCQHCLDELPLYGVPWCDRCGADHTAKCRCGELGSDLSWIRSAGPFRGWLRSAVHDFKYHGERTRAEHLAGLLTPLVAGAADVNALAPVPLSRRRERERGYNQTRDMARIVGAQLALPIIEPLQRQGGTPHQVGLGRAERWQNVADAFTLVENCDITGLRLLIVDDVLTTGATLDACAKALVSGGAEWVGAVTVARED